MITGEATRTALTVVLVLAHAGTAAAWVGGMLYSLFVVQPKAARFFGTDDEAHEAFLTTMASGNRRKVLALMAVLALTGAGLLVVDTPPTAVEWAMRLAELALLLAALAVFVNVSWRLWPRRVFAMPDERPAVRARFQHSAYALVGLAGAAFVMGLVASQLR
jgi:uncharacterized membrane protein